MKKLIDCGNGKMVEFKATASVPRIYRLKFGRDFFKDIKHATTSMGDSNSENSDLAIEDLECFENIAWVMAKHANPSVPDDITEWLDEFEMFSIYEILPQIVQLWGSNLIQTAEVKKNQDQLTGK